VLAGGVATTASARSLQEVLEDVPTDPRQVRFFAHDTQDRPLSGLDVVADPAGGYLGVYFWPHGPGPADYTVSVGHSPDLLTWTRIVDLDVDGGNMPVIVPAGPRGFLVAYEDYTELIGTNARSQLRVRWYADRDDLLRNAWSDERLLPRTVSFNNEGTPSIESVRWKGSPQASSIRIGFHYNAGTTGVDRQARGVLRGFRDWQAEPEEGADGRLDAAGFGASHGKRVRLKFGGAPLVLRELQQRAGDFSSWSLALEGLDGAVQPLRLRSREVRFASVGVPNVKFLPDPDGPGRVLFVSAYVFGAQRLPAARLGPALLADRPGPLLYLRRVGTTPGIVCGLIPLPLCN